MPVNLHSKKRLVARMYDVGMKRISFDSDHLDDVADAITRDNIRSLLTANTIKIKPIVGTSKGKGFQGVVKRHGFAGSPKTHGHKDQHRMPGSIGATGPARVFKGTRMGGHMGVDRVTVKNLEIMEINEEANEMLLKGAIPGARGGIIMVSTYDGGIEATSPVSEEVKEESKVEVKGHKRQIFLSRDTTFFIKLHSW